MPVPSRSFSTSHEQLATVMHVSSCVFVCIPIELFCNSLECSTEPHGHEPHFYIMRQQTKWEVGCILSHALEIAAQHAENVFRCVQSKCATWSVMVVCSSAHAVIQRAQSFSTHSLTMLTNSEKGILCRHTCLQMVYNIKWHAEHNCAPSAEGFEQRYSTMHGL